MVSRFRLPLACTLALATLLSLPARAGAPEDWQDRSEALADQLMGELKAELQAALQAGGPVAAVDVCKTRAPAIAERLSRSSGADVGRTALRVRNSANAPDYIEEGAMKRLERDMQATPPPGKPPAMLIEWPNVRTGGVDRYYLRVIVMQPECVACHGETLAPEIAAALRREYPLDQATGFVPGQLRGAVVVRWPAVSSTQQE